MSRLRAWRVPVVTVTWNESCHFRLVSYKMLRGSSTRHLLRTRPLRILASRARPVQAHPHRWLATKKPLVHLEGGETHRWQIVKSMSRYLWPKGEPAVKMRVVGAMGLLVASKVLTVQVNPTSTLRLPS